MIWSKVEVGGGDAAEPELLSLGIHPILILINRGPHMTEALLPLVGGMRVEVAGSET